MRWLCVLMMCFSATINAKPQPVADGFGVVWSLLPINEEQVLVAERHGQLSLLTLSSGNKQVISAVPSVHAEGQGGLLDLALLPAKPHPWLYFTYAQPDTSGASTALARARLNLDAMQLQATEVLLTSNSAFDSNRHFGSRIAFHGDYVFMSIGDRGERATGQRLDTHAGKILRLHLNGSVPTDNPFVDQEGALPEIWSYGHRNPQGLIFDAANDTLWAIEHGPRGGDELNRIVKGGNYGWAEVSLGKEYWNPMYVGEHRQHPDMIDPVYSFTPSIAPGSLLLWHSDDEHTVLLSGALKLRHLNQLSIRHDTQQISEKRWLEELDQRIRALAKLETGELLFATDNGTIYRWSLPSSD
ncbi:dehydrogenase [Bacterioplanes sanyensis]|uniref:PQQ-dependent sugar dehydrogenase n=1 Tax=Bacterioplanes sanyensis TaxID=1249553 RepID=UPI001674C1ED|nr:PQQ-dependent sugar dehydrogenase [Bacterioplanes sanyensis]GGY38098.1 dehydrogenase [Bacterioplanes sanyensis]